DFAQQGLRCLSVARRLRFADVELLGSDLLVEAVPPQGQQALVKCLSEGRLVLRQRLKVGEHRSHNSREGGVERGDQWLTLETWDRLLAQPAPELARGSADELDVTVKAGGGQLVAQVWPQQQQAQQAELGAPNELAHCLGIERIRAGEHGLEIDLGTDMR